MKKIILFCLLGVQILILGINQVYAVDVVTESYDDIIAATSEKLTTFNENRKITQIKELSDFSDNKYFIVELYPTGYLIYHENSEDIVEWAEDSPSPYLNLDGNLYYGGPTFYYQANSLTANHTITSETLLVENFNQYVSRSNEMNDLLVANAIEKQSAIALYETLMKSELPPPDMQPMNYTRAIANSSFYRNMTSNVGYATVSGTEGICGYIALNLLIGYHDKYNNDNIMDDVYWSNAYKVGLKNHADSLSLHLYNLNPKNGTISVDIHETMLRYSTERGLSFQHEDWIAPIAMNPMITAAIDHDRPVIYFGWISDPRGGDNITHAVVVYEYTLLQFWGITYGFAFKAHYGWQNYSQVNFSGVLGSLYYFF